ncbi:MAG: hypothetical protein J6U54_00115 [Clostridiales bacterium]|nr:hypothetical protein [Clostridiales bacterium]
MAKRILSVILVLVVFFGGYSIVPKKYNLLPVNDAFCASHYGGVYRVRKDIKISASEMASLGYILIGGSSYTIRAGKTITLTRDGILSTSPKISLKKYVDNGYMYLLYR